MATTFGQLVVGPPGSGKSTYCRAMQQFLGAAGRPTAVINLDPANDSVPYDCAASITDLISLTDVMDEHGLGPNGGARELTCRDRGFDDLTIEEPLLQP